MNMKDQKPTDQMEEAYKQLDGAPAQDAVSKAAKGEQPLTDDESRMEEANDTSPENSPKDTTDDTAEETSADGQGDDIDTAYIKLFEGLAGIIRNKE